MPLDKQNVVINLGEIGLDQGKHPHVATGLLSAQNVTFSQDGALRKRPGTRVLTPDSATENYSNTFMGSAGNVPFIIGGNVKAYSTLAPDAGYAGNLVDLSLKGGLMSTHSREIMTTGRFVDCYTDYAEAGSVYAVMYSNCEPHTTGAQTYSLYLETYETATHRRLATAELDLASSARSLGRLVVVSSTSIVAYYISNSKIYYRTVNVTTGAISSAVQITGMTNNPAVTTANIMDACAITDNVNAAMSALAYIADDNLLYIITLTSGTTYHSDIKEQAPTGVEPYNVSVCSTALNRFQVGYTLDNAGSAQLSIQEYDHALSSIYGPTTASSIEYDNQLTSIGDGSGGGVFYHSGIIDDTSSSDDNFPSQHAIVKQTYSAGAVTSNLPYIVGCKLASKPVRYGTRIITAIKWGACEWDNLSLKNIDTRLAFIDENAVVIGQSLEGVVRFADKTASINRHLPTLMLISSRYLRSAFCYTSRLGAGDDREGDVCLVSRLEGDILPTPQLLTNGDGAIVGNSMPYSFDGQELTELGFWRYPHALVLKVSAVEALDMEAGTYSYKAVYEYTDANGKIFRSAASVSVSILATVDKAVEVYVPQYSPTRVTTIRIVIYRTTAGGTIFYRIGSVTNIPNTTGPSSSYLLFYDMAADSDIVIGEQIYTDSGELDNIAPYSVGCMCWHQGRVVYSSADSPKTDVYYSKTATQGEQVSFNDAMMFRAPPEGGNIVALSSHGDRLYILKETSIYMVDGGGVDSYGAGYNYRQPAVLIDPAIGCTDKRSVIATSKGIMFQGADNIYLINGMELQAIGGPVYETVSNTTITGTALILDGAAVFFAVNNAIYQSLIYDIQSNRWATWTNEYAISCLTLGSTLYRYSSGYILGDNTAFYDTNYELTKANIPLRVVTPWLTFSGIKGFQRVYRTFIIGQNISAHRLQVRIGYDYDPAWTDTQTYNTDALTAFGHTQYYETSPTPSTADQAMIVSVAGSRQKCFAIRFEITDLVHQTESWSTADPPVLTMVDEDPPTEHMSLTSLACLIGIKRGGQPPRGRKAS